jgi:hypothetical protein
MTENNSLDGEQTFNGGVYPIRLQTIVWMESKLSTEIQPILRCINHLNAELYPICHFLALLGAHHIFHVSRIRVKQIGSPCCNAWSYNSLKYLAISGADKSLAQTTSLSIVFSVQGVDGSLVGPDPEKRMGDHDIGSPGRPVSSGLQVSGEPFSSWSG